MADDNPVNRDDAFIVLATALPELMADTGEVFEQQNESGEWNAERIAQASARVTELAKNETVAGSETVATVLSALGDNYDALTEVNTEDSQRLASMRELFTQAPALTLNCNGIAADMEAIGALITHLQDPAWPVNLSDAAAEKISIELLSSQNADDEDASANGRIGEDTYPLVEEVDLTVALAQDINPALREAFMSEMPERVREFSDCIARLIAGTGNNETLFAAQRAAHTIKGSAHVSGVTGMGWLTHLSEDIVEYITESKSSRVPEGAYDLLQTTGDCLEGMVDHLQGIGPYPDETSSVYNDLRDMYLTMSNAPIQSSGDSASVETESIISDTQAFKDNADDSSSVKTETELESNSDASAGSANAHDAVTLASDEALLPAADFHVEVPRHQPADLPRMDSTDTGSSEETQFEPGEAAPLAQKSATNRTDDSALTSDNAEHEAETALEDEALSGQERSFVTLAKALPELMTDTGVVFDQCSEAGEWNADSIAQASQRVATLANDEAVAGSEAVSTIFKTMATNFDALSGIDSKDTERLETLRTLFTMTPALTLNCSNVGEDMEAVGALVAHLQDPAWPVELSEADVEKISLELLSDSHSEDFSSDTSEAVSEDTYPLVGDVDLTVALAQDINPALREAFMSEMPERVREFSDCIAKLVAGTGNDETLFAAQRAAHTIKGSAHVSGVTGMGWLTHLSEDIVEYITESKSSEIPDGAYDLLQTTGDCLDGMVDHLQGAGPYPEETAQTYSKLREMYLTMSSGAGSLDGSNDNAESIVNEEQSQQNDSVATRNELAAEVSDGEKSITVAAMPEFRPSRARMQKEKQSDAATEKTIHLNARQLKSLQNLAGDVSIHNVRMGGFSGDINQALSDLARQQASVQQRLEDLTTLLMYQGVQSNVVKPDENDEDFDALEMDQYTELHSATNLAYEAVVDAQAMTSNIQREVKSFSEILADNGRVSRDFNSEVSNIRMVTFAELAPRLQRVARQTAKATGKTVELVIEGEDVQFDRDLYNPLADALLHAIRNSIDHGIELPEERLAKDKPETGTVTIRLEKDAGDIMISCHDDGSGLDFDAIRDKAISKNQFKAGAEPTQDELAQLIFAPGFSTRQDVSQISGRGMGMNIVFEAIRTRHGSVDVESDAKNGTTVRMRMPMSLMSMHLIIAKYGDETFAIPSNSVEQLVLSDMGEVITRDAEDGGQDKIFRMGDVEWKIFALGTLLGSDAEATISSGKESFPLVLLKTPQGNYAVRMRHASDSGVMVVKGFGSYIQRINGILGGAILADGSVCPVLDLAELAIYRGDALRIAQTNNVEEFVAQEEEFVLVVDDSLSARRALVQLMIDAGFETREARDGLDAIEVMDKAKPKVLITDLEMPRMNGVELVQHIRSRDKDNDLPIIMITSRSTAKHKSRAMDAGVSDYVNKPWDEDKLVDLVSSYLVNKLADVA